MAAAGAYRPARRRLRPRKEIFRFRKASPVVRHGLIRHRIRRCISWTSTPPRAERARVRVFRNGPCMRRTQMRRHRATSQSSRAPTEPESSSHIKDIRSTRSRVTRDQTKPMATALLNSADTGTWHGRTHRTQRRLPAAAAVPASTARVANPGRRYAARHCTKAIAQPDDVRVRTR